MTYLPLPPFRCAWIVSVLHSTRPPPSSCTCSYALTVTTESTGKVCQHGISIYMCMIMLHVSWMAGGIECAIWEGGGSGGRVGGRGREKKRERVSEWESEFEGHFIPCRSSPESDHLRMPIPRPLRKLVCTCMCVCVCLGLCTVVCVCV